MTEPQKRMLQTLFSEGGTMFRGVLLNHSKSYSSGYRVLDKLESMGLIKATPDYSARDVWIKLTDQGRKVITQ